jgi:hypothetical protein
VQWPHASKSRNTLAKKLQQMNVAREASPQKNFRLITSNKKKKKFVQSSKSFSSRCVLNTRQYNFIFPRSSGSLLCHIATLCYSKIGPEITKMNEFEIQGFFVCVLLWWLSHTHFGQPKRKKEV